MQGTNPMGPWRTGDSMHASSVHGQFLFRAGLCVPLGGVTCTSRRLSMQGAYTVGNPADGQDMNKTRCQKFIGDRSKPFCSRPGCVAIMCVKRSQIFHSGRRSRDSSRVFGLQERVM